MKRLILFISLMTVFGAYTQTVNTDIIELEHPNTEIQETEDGYAEWKTSKDTTVLHYVRYDIDSVEVSHITYDILTVEEGNEDIIITIDGESKFTISFWKDHSKVVYRYNERYIVITGDLKF